MGTRFPPLSITFRPSTEMGSIHTLAGRNRDSARRENSIPEVSWAIFLHTNISPPHDTKETRTWSSLQRSTVEKISPGSHVFMLEYRKITSRLPYSGIPLQGRAHAFGTQFLFSKVNISRGGGGRLEELHSPFPALTANSAAPCLAHSGWRAHQMPFAELGAFVDEFGHSLHMTSRGGQPWERGGETSTPQALGGVSMGE